jgi:hypothetical protein
VYILFSSAVKLQNLQVWSIWGRDDFVGLTEQSSIQLEKILFSFEILDTAMHACDFVLKVACGSKANTCFETKGKVK